MSPEHQEALADAWEPEALRLKAESRELNNDPTCPQCNGDGWIGHYVRGDWKIEACPHCGGAAVCITQLPRR